MGPYWNSRAEPEPIRNHAGLSLWGGRANGPGAKERHLPHPGDSCRYRAHLWIRQSYKRSDAFGLARRVLIANSPELLEKFVFPE